MRTLFLNLLKYNHINCKNWLKIDFEKNPKYIWSLLKQNDYVMKDLIDIGFKYNFLDLFQNIADRAKCTTMFIIFFPSTTTFELYNYYERYLWFSSNEISINLLLLSLNKKSLMAFSLFLLNETIRMVFWQCKYFHWKHFLRSLWELSKVRSLFYPFF